MAVTGLPEPNADHAVAMADFALQLDCRLAAACASLGLESGALSVRTGLHSGSVTAGVLRADRSRFQLFGDTVNTASRMESTGQAGRIQVSAATAELLRAAATHTLRYRGKVAAKGKGELDAFWLLPLTEGAPEGGSAADALC
jgi:class 3 adenylate cyclase